MSEPLGHFMCPFLAVTGTSGAFVQDLTAALLKRSRQTGQWVKFKPPSGWNPQLCSQASLPQRPRLSGCVGVVPTICCALSSLTMICPLASVPCPAGAASGPHWWSQGLFPLCSSVSVRGTASQGSCHNRIARRQVIKY